MCRLGTAEVESALLKGSKDVSEAAVVGFPHEIKGMLLMRCLSPTDSDSDLLCLSN